MVKFIFSIFILTPVFLFFNQAKAQNVDTLLYQGTIPNIEMQLQFIQQQNDSLQFANRFLGFSIELLEQQIDSLENEIVISKSARLLPSLKIDTLEKQKTAVMIELLAIKQQKLALSTEKEEILALLSEKDFQLNECKIKLKDALSAAELKQLKLEGKIDVHSVKVEAKDKEITYLQKEVEEKSKQLEKTTLELSQSLSEKRNSIHIIDSLARELNARELQLVKVNERLRIIESQYNEMLAQRAAATNKKKKVRFVQGVGLKNYRTPDWQLAPQSSASTSTYVITNKNAGNIEFDYITGISLSLYDLTKDEGKFTYDAGLFVGFGGTNLFKNFYIAPSFKAFDYFHFMLGFNIAEYQQLQRGFLEGDALPGGMSIPTVKEWKANIYLGMTIDFELLANIPKKL